MIKDQSYHHQQQQQNQPPQATSSAAPMNKSVKICGHDVYFPPGKIPFSSQKSVISKALIALTKGHNALLESPTGTGKTLALLTSTLSWQKKSYEVELETYDAAVAAAEQQRLQDLEHTNHVSTSACVRNEKLEHGTKSNDDNGGASVTSSEEWELKGSELHPLHQPVVVKLPASRLPPRPKRRQIYFCARTHSQLQQSVNELKSCHDTYLETLSMCVLSARKNLCVNEELLQQSRRPDTSAGSNYASVEEGCRNLLRENNCRFNNMHTTQRCGEELGKNVWDIEDALWMGRKYKGCPYFASRKLHEKNPAITFAPYTYLLNSSIRSALNIDLRGAVVVFDEAHNIESACREAASCEVFLSALKLLRSQLHHASSQQACPMSYKAMHDLVSPLTQWLSNTADLLAHSDLDNGSDHIWTGEEALAMFRDELHLTPSSLALFVEHLQLVVANEEEVERQNMQDLREGGGGASARINVQYEEEEQQQEEEGDSSALSLVGGGSVSGMRKKGALTTFLLQLLKDLFRIFKYMLQDEAQCIGAYKLVVLRVKRGKEWDFTLNLWCLSASVAFRDFAACHSVMLTSGTLSPLESFSAELGVDFPVKVEAQHVIDTDSQVLASAVSKFGDVDLKCTFHFHDDVKYQDALGGSLLSIRRASTAGMLVFFSSYGLMEKLMQRWEHTGLRGALASSGDVGADLEMSERGEKGGRHSEVENNIFMEPRDSKDLEVTLKRYYDTIDKCQPGILFAIARGKVSEGIDFADDYARTVCVVGIPFPALRDLQVKLKRNYQDEQFKHSPQNLPGDKWYSQEAYRAVNQAVGRCIRHVKDFGAIIFLDPRFALVESQSQLSKWLRGKVVNYDQLSDLLVPLRSFNHSNRVKFSEHLAGLRKSRMPNLQASSVSSVNSVAHKKQNIINNKEEVKLSGKQSAVVNMFSKYSRKAKEERETKVVEEVTVANQESSIDLSDFALDYFISKSHTSFFVDQSLRYHLKLQVAKWTMSDACLPPSSSSSSSAAVYCLDDERIQLRDVMAVKLPVELSYLNEYMFRRGELFLSDGVSSGSGSSSRTIYDLPANSVAYAVALMSWSWAEDRSLCEQLGSKLHNIQIREHWVPQDEVAYRLLEYSEDSDSLSTKTRSILLAASVIGSSKRVSAYLDHSWMNIELALLLYRESSQSSSSASGGDNSMATLMPTGYISSISRSLWNISDESNQEIRNCDSTNDDDLFAASTQQFEESSPLRDVTSQIASVCGKKCSVDNSCMRSAAAFPNQNESEVLNIHQKTVYSAANTNNYNELNSDDDDFVDVFTNGTRKKPRNCK